MIFDRQIARKPDHYPWTQAFIDSMWHTHWTPNEFSFQSDLQDFKTQMSPDEQGVIVRTLSAIGQIEIEVKTFWRDLGQHLPHPSLTDLGVVMANVEVIHNKAYEKLLSVLGLEEVFEANLEVPEVIGRVEYLKKWKEVGKTPLRSVEAQRQAFLDSLILFTLFVENVSLFSQFYIVLWFNRNKAILKDTAQQVQYTKNEEMVHGQVGSRIVRVIREEYPEWDWVAREQRVQELCLKAYEAEAKVVDWLLQGFAEAELNPVTLKAYVRYRFDQSLEECGFAPCFGDWKDEESSFWWMQEEILAPSCTDFFHKRPVEYAKGNLSFEGELF